MHTDTNIDPDSRDKRRHEDEILAARSDYTRRAASVLDQCGRGFSALGLADGARRAIGIVVQLAASISLGATEMYARENWYAGAALVRQFVELEYLLFLFATDTAEATQWLSSSPGDLRRVYTPAAMRKRSKGHFRDAEYWSHCEVGGHPHWKAAVLLPERVEAVTFPSREVLWLDLAHHLTRMLHSLDRAVEAHGLTQIGVVAEARAKAAKAYEEWTAADPAATKAPDPIGSR
jgi:hypothetical protein